MADPLAVTVAGIEFRPTLTRTRKALERRKNRPDANAVRFVLGRAAAFVLVQVPGSREEVRRPAWNYAQIARNLRRARGFKLTPRAVKRLVEREDPGLAAVRVAANTPARRKHPRTGAEVPNHWLLKAYDRIRAGGHEPTVMARLGWVRKGAS